MGLSAAAAKAGVSSLAKSTVIHAGELSFGPVSYVIHAGELSFGPVSYVIHAGESTKPQCRRPQIGERVSAAVSLLCHVHVRVVDFL